MRLRSWITGSEHLHWEGLLLGAPGNRNRGFLSLFFFIVFAISAVSFAEDKENGG